MSLAAGSRLGPYEIVATLGAGGMGEVYRALDPRLGREVALKVLPEAFARDRERLARFEREARTVAGFSHPNIVTLFSIEEDAGVRFLTMELVEGQTLDRLVVTGGLPLARVLDLAIPLAEALVAAHARGVVHRDLNPANLMVTRERRVKVLDFGLAKPAADRPAPGGSQAPTQDSPLSSAGAVLGTVPYMAPEQVRGAAVDARADLFSPGVMIYELAGGRRPFTVSGTVDRGANGSQAALRGSPPRQSARIETRGDTYECSFDVGAQTRMGLGA
mgnify:CR=1 FL=1